MHSNRFNQPQRVTLPTEQSQSLRQLGQFLLAAPQLHDQRCQVIAVGPTGTSIRRRLEKCPGLAQVLAPRMRIPKKKTLNDIRNQLPFPCRGSTPVLLLGNLLNRQFNPRQVAPVTDLRDQDQLEIIALFDFHRLQRLCRDWTRSGSCVPGRRQRCEPRSIQPVAVPPHAVTTLAVLVDDPARHANPPGDWTPPGNPHAILCSRMNHQAAGGDLTGDLQQDLGDIDSHDRQVVAMPDMESLVLVVVLSFLVQQPFGQETPPRADPHLVFLALPGRRPSPQAALHQRQPQCQRSNLLVQFLDLQLVGGPGWFYPLGTNDRKQIVGFFLLLGARKRITGTLEDAIPRVVVLGIDRVVLVIVATCTAQ